MMTGARTQRWSEHFPVGSIMVTCKEGKIPLGSLMSYSLRDDLYTRSGLGLQQVILPGPRHLSRLHELACRTGLGFTAGVDPGGLGPLPL